MTKLNVPGMSCGHCTSAIEKSVRAIDPTAKVSCDLGAHTVDVDSFLSQRALSEAIQNAGYDVKASVGS